MPWQAEKTAYYTWLSEIMLQQTQVKTVIPYFQRFLQSFPDVQTLAKAPQDKVLHLWTGLGYYARARNLHKTAQIIHQEFNSIFPNTQAELEQLPGIGRSTAGAILSIAYQQPATILDGNVKRVLARFYGVEGWTGSNAIQKKLWQHAEQNTPTERTGDYSQAMMDMGATVCTRSKPSCNCCPIQIDCVAFKQDLTTALPTPKPKKALPKKQCFMLIIHNKKGAVLLEQRPASGLWGGLWSLPELEDLKDSEAKIGVTIKQQNIERLDSIEHRFSHFQLEIKPLLVSLELNQQIKENRPQLWYDLAKPESIGLAAPVKKLLLKVKDQAK